jgi:hypothetical protein
MQIASTLCGIFAAIFMLLGLIPLLGWINWLVLPCCVLGVMLGVFSKGRRPGLVINLVVASVAALRLILGGGLV